MNSKSTELPPKDQMMQDWDDFDVPELDLPSSVLQADETLTVSNYPGSSDSFWPPSNANAELLPFTSDALQSQHEAPLIGNEHPHIQMSLEIQSNKDPLSGMCQALDVTSLSNGSSTEDTIMQDAQTVFDSDRRLFSEFTRGLTPPGNQPAVSSETEHWSSPVRNNDVPDRSMDQDLYDHGFRDPMPQQNDAQKAALTTQGVAISSAANYSVSNRRPVRRRATNNSRLRKQQTDSLPARPKARRPTKLEELLGGCYGVHTLSLPRKPRAKNEHKNVLALREQGGQCMRCIYYRRKCSPGYPCQQCQSISRNQEVDCVSADVDSFNIFSLGAHKLEDFSSPVENRNTSMGMSTDFGTVMKGLWASYSHPLQIGATKLHMFPRIRSFSIEKKDSEPFDFVGNSKNPLTAYAVLVFTSELLFDESFLLALARDEANYLKACWARSGTYLLKFLDRFLRRKLPQQFYMNPLEHILFLAIFAAQMSQLFFKATVDIAWHEFEQAYLFLDKYLSECEKLLANRPAYPSTTSCQRGLEGWGLLPETWKSDKLKSVCTDEEEQSFHRFIELTTGSHEITLQQFANILPPTWWKMSSTLSFPKFVPGELLWIMVTTCLACGQGLASVLSLIKYCSEHSDEIRCSLFLVSKVLIQAISKMREFMEKKFLDTLPSIFSSWENIIEEPPLVKSLAEAWKLLVADDYVQYGKDLCQVTGDRWLGFIHQLFRCVVPIALHRVGILDFEELWRCLCLLGVVEPYREVAGFMCFHEMGQLILEGWKTGKDVGLDRNVWRTNPATKAAR